MLSGLLHVIHGIEGILRKEDQRKSLIHHGTPLQKLIKEQTTFSLIRIFGDYHEEKSRSKIIRKLLIQKKDL